MAELRVANLTKSYPTPAEPLVVVRDVSLELTSGDALAIMGPSGSGKSSLLYVLGTLETPTEGSVTLDGENPFGLEEKALAGFRNRRIGFVFQEHHLLPQCTALENVLIPTLAPGAPVKGEAAAARAKMLLERVGLGDRLEHRPAQLSGGERQRVAIARALIHEPTLVLADEPTGNLDSKTSDAVAELLLELHGERETILVTVTHSAALAERFPKRAELLDGQLSNV